MDRRLLLGGGAAASLLLLWASWPGAPGSESVELVPQAAPALAAPPPLAQPTASVVTADGLVLHGLTGSGAIVASGNGGQRFVRIGREVRPGLVLAGVGQHHALLRSAAGDTLLGFTGAEPAAAPPERAAAPAEAGGSPFGKGMSEAQHREATLQYRLGLVPRKTGGRTDGFVIRPGADMPALAKAGLRPGDVILEVNGQSFTEERVMELSQEIAGSFTAEFRIERRGRPMTLQLAVAPRQ